MKTNRGFTLLELLATLTILAIIGAVVVPSYLSSQKKARTDAAISRAAVLDIAKANYLQNKGTDAWDIWDTIETTYAADPDGMNNAKYQELKPFLSSAAEPILGVGGDTAGPNEYTPRGFKYELNGLTDQTTVIDLDGGGVVAGLGAADAVKVKITRTTFEADGVTPSAEIGGVVSGSGLYAVGSTANLVAYPRLGFAFKEWLEGGSDMSSANQVTVGPFAAAGTMNYEATFVKLPPGTYNLIVTVNPAGGGSVSINPNKPSYNNGESVTLTATPAAGYTFDRWFGTGVSSTSNPLTVTMDQNRQIYANFIPPSYNVVVNNPAIAGAGTTVPSGGTTTQVIQGSSLAISATPNLGYDFVEWQGLPGGPSPVASQIITVNQNLTLTPVYVAAPTYNLNVTVSPAGYGTAIIGTGSATSADLYKNQSTNISAFAGQGRLFDRWILAAGNGSLSDLASVTTTFTMDANPAAVNTVTAQFKDNQLASEVITIPPGKSYIKTTAEPSAVGITTPNGLFDPAVQVDLTAQVSESFPNFRFVRWAKKPDTNTTISLNPTTTVTSPPEGVLDEYVAYFEIGVNKFLNDIPTFPYKPVNTVVSPARDKLLSAVGLDGIITQGISNTNAANITQICQLKYPTDAVCMNAESQFILLGSTTAGKGIRLFTRPAYQTYDTAASTNATNPLTTGANNITFAARDIAAALPLDVSGNTGTFYAVSSTQVTQFNKKAATPTEKEYWKQEFTYTNTLGWTSKSIAVRDNGDVYVLYQSPTGQNSIWNFNKANVSTGGPTQVLGFAFGETYNMMRFRPSISNQLQVIRGGAGYTTTNEIAVVTVNGATPATLNYKYSYTQAGTGDPKQIVFGKDGNTAEDILVVSGPTRTVSLRIPAIATTFTGAIGTGTGPFWTYGSAAGEANFGFSLAMARNPQSILSAEEIISLPGPNATGLGHFGYGLRYPLSGGVPGVTFGVAGPVKRCMMDARGLAFDQTGNYLYVTDRGQTNFSQSHLVVFDMSSPAGTFVGGTFSNNGGIGASDKIGGLGADNVNSSFFGGPGGPGNFYHVYMAVENAVAGTVSGVYQFIQKPSGLPEVFKSATLSTVDWAPVNIWVAPQVQRLWAVQFGGGQVAAFDLSTNTYPRITAFTLEGGTSAVGIATPPDGNELIVSFGGSGITPKIGIYDNQTGQEKRSLVFPFTGATSLQGIYYDDVDSFIYASDSGDARILKFGP